MERVTSKDGTTIAYPGSGIGTPVLLVHGATHDHTVWTPVRSVLERHYRVYAMDRRGRGHSGDAAAYALEREWEDIAAVIDAIGGAVDVVGHSNGGMCALEVARLTENVRRLVLYEPTMPVGSPRTEICARMQALIDAGEPEQALLVFCRDALKLPPPELAAFQESPGWSARVAVAHTIPRELQAVDTYQFDPRHFQTMQAPTLFLVGGDSPPFRRTVAEALQAGLPNSQIGVLVGQRHGAIEAAPDLFAKEVMRFLSPGQRHHLD
ncbi:MAG: alpha/beta fold hydrolase [Candidatus Rokuibacteriota bacterium]